MAELRIGFVIMALLAVSISPVFAQSSGATSGAAQVETAGMELNSPPAKTTEASIFVGPEYPSLLKNLKVDGYELIEASIAVEDKGAKVTYSPFLFTGNYTFLSETRLQLSQANGVTTTGFSLRYNPLSPRSRNGGRIWNDFWSGARDYDTAAEDQIPVVAEALNRAREEFNKKNIEVVPEIEDLQRRTDFLAEQLAKLELKDQWPEFAKELKEKQESLAALNLEAEKKRFERVLSQAPDKRQEPLDLGRSEIAALEARLKELESQGGALFKKRVLEYYTALLNSRRPVVSLSYNASFFSTLGGTDVDKDGDGLADSGERFSGQALALSVDWRWSERGQLSGLMSWGEQRESAEAESPLRSAVGWGLTAGYVLKILDSAYQQSKAFQESMFIPSLVLGFSVEGLECQEPDDVGCKEMLIRQIGYTPFLDVKISKASQFRLGFPIKKTTRVTGEEGETDLGVTTLVSFQLGSGS